MKNGTEDRARRIVMLIAPLLIGLGVFFLFAVFFIVGTALQAFSEHNDPEVSRLAGIEHARSLVMPELWLDEYPEAFFEITKPFYVSFEDSSGSATFLASSAMDLKQYAKDHPTGRSGKWKWNLVAVGPGGEPLRYEAHVLDDLPFGVFIDGSAGLPVEQLPANYEGSWVFDKITTFVLDLETNQIRYSTSSE